MNMLLPDIPAYAAASLLGRPVDRFWRDVNTSSRHPVLLLVQNSHANGWRGGVQRRFRAVARFPIK